jgi:hypothetical protein
MARPEKTLIHDEITRRAYEIWVAEGRPTGRALAHWIMAKKQLLALPVAAPKAGAQEAAPAPALVGSGVRRTRSATIGQMGNGRP